MVNREIAARWLGSGIPVPSLPYRAGAFGAGVVFVIGVLLHFGLDARGVISVILVIGFTAIAVIDLEHRVIPNRVVVPLIGVVLLLQLAFFSDRAFEWIAAGAGAALVLLIPSFIRPGSVGMGDVKLAILMGVGLGRDVIAGMLLGSLAIVPVALWILATHGPEARKEMIPLGPFLAAGGVLALFLGGSL